MAAQGGETDNELDDNLDSANYHYQQHGDSLDWSLPLNVPYGRAFAQGIMPAEVSPYHTRIELKDLLDRMEEMRFDSFGTCHYAEDGELVSHL